MFSLNPREQLLIVAILAVTVAGAALTHWRAAQREAAGAGHPAAAVSAAPLPVARIQKAPDDGEP